MTIDSSSRDESRRYKFAEYARRNNPRALRYSVFDVSISRQCRENNVEIVVDAREPTGRWSAAAGLRLRSAEEIHRRTRARDVLAM